jgi:hypothetical protein
VRLLAGGHDGARGQHYLALEWLQEDLVTHLRGQGASQARRESRGRRPGRAPAREVRQT